MSANNQILARGTEGTTPVDDRAPADVEKEDNQDLYSLKDFVV